MNMDASDFAMSRKMAAGLFLAVLLDPNVTDDQKGKMVDDWNRHEGKGRGQ